MDRALQPDSPRADARAAEADVPSPCVKICQMNAVTGLCFGCLRTLEEVALWSSGTPEWKRRVLAAIEAREAAAFDNPTPR